MENTQKKYTKEHTVENDKREIEVKIEFEFGVKLIGYDEVLCRLGGFITLKVDMIE